MSPEQESLFLSGTNRKKLLEYLKRSVDLTEFISTHAGGSFRRKGSRWWSVCPLPSHKEKTASFCCSIGKTGAWRYVCYGCKSTGSIIDFAIACFDISTIDEALVYLADKLDLKTNLDWMAQEIRNTKEKVDKVGKAEMAHFVACNRCRILLKKKIGEGVPSAWVGRRYREMNTLMDSITDENVDAVIERLERISSGAVRLSCSKDNSEIERVCHEAT